MHLRRALLLMAVVLLAAAAVQLLVPIPRTRDRPLAQPERNRPGTTRAAAPTRTVDLRYPAAKPVPAPTVPRGAHVLVRVSARATGQVSLTGFGLVQAVEPGTPAVFDVLAMRPGHYDVAFEPVVGRSVRIGRLTVSESGRRP
jgi:hypothetical protein